MIILLKHTIWVILHHPELSAAKVIGEISRMGWTGI